MARKISMLLRKKTATVHTGGKSKFPSSTRARSAKKLRATPSPS
jgi:hypothetical protein